jgi:hypothetical protein
VPNRPKFINKNRITPTPFSQPCPSLRSDCPLLGYHCRARAPAASLWLVE